MIVRHQPIPSLHEAKIEGGVASHGFLTGPLFILVIRDKIQEEDGK